MIKSKNIELFENLSQSEYKGKFIDFHNDYMCVKILLSPKNLFEILFENLIDKSHVKLVFSNVIIVKMIFFNSSKVENLTIDNLYRGKIEDGNKLIEFKDSNKGYFYLEFYEGQKIEFWSTGLKVEDSSKPSNFI